MAIVCPRCGRQYDFTLFQFGRAVRCDCGATVDAKAPQCARKEPAKPEKGESVSTKREVVKRVLEGKKPPYVPWSFGFTHEARQKLVAHYRTEDLGPHLQNHIRGFGSGIGFMEPLGDDCYRDYFGAVWNRSRDKDIGVVKGEVLPEPTLKGYAFPDPKAPALFADMENMDGADGLRVYRIGFSLFERAWTLRGMENLMMDMIEEPGFVHELLTAIADWNLAVVEKALEYDIDAVYFGDDWGQQHGLIMGPEKWCEFVYPQLKRMYGAVRAGGKYVFIHSCGDVDELFDDLVAIGLDCFNPFQPEVMDVETLMQAYRGRLTFHGGLSTQRTLPYGTAADVKRETEKLLALGREGNYVFSPAHAVEGDVPLENMLAFIETVKAQDGALS